MSAVLLFSFSLFDRDFFFYQLAATSINSNARSRLAVSTSISTQISTYNRRSSVLTTRYRNCLLESRPLHPSKVEDISVSAGRGLIELYRLIAIRSPCWPIS